jgi:hypothetical protein
MCDAGISEVEIHLHHDNDSGENLERLLRDYKKRLYEYHNLLSKDTVTGDISYAFIHGNWALNNSRHDKRWCGVNDETSILKRTGCYADFTLPSAPSSTQTRKVNSIYYAIPNPNKPKGHDWGVNSQVGMSNDGLLMIQGPLCINWSLKKYGFLPRIENSDLTSKNAINKYRVNLWLDQAISVQGARDHRFIKLHTHGAQEKNIDLLFNKNVLRDLYRVANEISSECGSKIYFTSAREMANAIKSLESGFVGGGIVDLNYRFVR